MHACCMCAARHELSTGQSRGDNSNELVIGDDLDAATNLRLDGGPASGGGMLSIFKAPPNLNTDEVLLDDELNIVVPTRAPETARFLELDKCLLQRQYLGVHCQYITLCELCAFFQLKVLILRGDCLLPIGRQHT